MSLRRRGENNYKSVIFDQVRFLGSASAGLALGVPLVSVQGHPTGTLPVGEGIHAVRQKEIIQHEEKCDDYVTARAQEKFHVNNNLCDTLNIIDTVCREDLEECFSDDDIVMMTVSHLKEMKKFLVRIARES